ncbi:MAG: hypothetical protein F9K29_05465 [Hyphomicrobiaceae bacterium]|nr:MAG: hypothetical protein F9K29_05465 [Hyphomicrobiaceae bacterium]
MELQDQRIACLRMAIEMGCKPDAVVGMAGELMDFVMNGAPAPAKSMPAEPAASSIAACGTVLPISETADLTLDLALAQPPAAPVAADEGEAGGTIATADPVGTDAPVEALSEAAQSPGEAVAAAQIAEVPATEPALAELATVETSSQAAVSGNPPTDAPGGEVQATPQAATEVPQAEALPVASDQPSAAEPTAAEPAASAAAAEHSTPLPATSESASSAQPEVAVPSAEAASVQAGEGAVEQPAAPAARGTEAASSEGGSPMPPPVVTNGAGQSNAAGAAGSTN